MATWLVRSSILVLLTATVGAPPDLARAEELANGSNVSAQAKTVPEAKHEDVARSTAEPSVASTTAASAPAPSAPNALGGDLPGPSGESSEGPAANTAPPADTTLSDPLPSPPAWSDTPPKPNVSAPPRRSEPTVVGYTEALDPNSEPREASLPDHWLVGHIAFGVGSLREPSLDLVALLATPEQQTTTTDTSDDSKFIPTLEGRFWIGAAKRWGIDVGLAYLNLDIQIDGAKTGHAGALCTRLGAPIALTSSRHMTIELIPQVGYLGLGTSTSDLGVNLYQWDMALRLSAEIHFGFIGIPELALQSGMGVNYSHQVVRSRVRNLLFSATTGEYGSTHQRAVATVVGPTGGKGPWEMFIGNLSALYYF